MSVAAWFTLIVVLAMLAVLTRDLLPPAAVVLAATTVLLVAGVIDQEQAFSGFSNPAPLTVAALYVLARGVEKTGILGPMISRLLGNPREVGRPALARLLIPTAGASAFLNNTPLVGTMIPEATAWASRHGNSTSRLLLPVSYAAILGGTLTLIGTSTNLVVSGLLEEGGAEPLGVFEMTPVSAVVAVLGLTVVIAFAGVLIPSRRSPGATLSEGVREFSVQMEVEPGGSISGRTVEGAGLRHLEGVYLAEIRRGSSVIAPVDPDRTVQDGDRLIFVGRSDLIVDLQRMRGLVPADRDQVEAIDSPQHTFFEAVVAPEGRLAGRTLQEVDFRRRYQGAVIAIHRAGERVRAKLGAERLRTGDTLLILADRGFRDRFGEGRDFLLVARLGGPTPSASRKAPLVGLIVAAVPVLAALEVLPILEGALLAGGALLATRVLTFGEARNAIDLQVVILIAAAFGVGAAIESTGLAAELANRLVGGLDRYGELGIVLGIVVATIVLTELITNNAAAVVVLPIGLSVATETGLDERQIAIAIAITASASFLTPMGYQTNTMVLGPGGYRFTDYLRLGLPVSVTVAIAITAMTVALA